MKINGELENLLDLAALTFGDDARAKQWLDTPLSAFKSQTPRQLVAAGRFRDVLRYLDSIQSGFVG